MLRVERLRRLAICAMASLVMIGVGSSARAQAPVKAEWQVQEIFLSYLGFTSLYSCDGMRDRVAGWIDQLGARDNRTGNHITVATEIFRCRVNHDIRAVPYWLRRQLRRERRQRGSCAACRERQPAGLFEKGAAAHPARSGHSIVLAQFALGSMVSFTAARA